MYVASKLGHLLWFPIGGPSHTSSGWLSVGLCTVSTLRQFSASLMKARISSVVPSMSMFEAVAVSGCAGWNRTFVFVTLTVRPKSLYASEKSINGVL